MKNLHGQIKKGWHQAGLTFEILGDSINLNNQQWTPIRYLNQDDPTFIKTKAITLIGKPEPIRVKMNDNLT